MTKYNLRRDAGELLLYIHEYFNSVDSREHIIVKEDLKNIKEDWGLSRVYPALTYLQNNDLIKLKLFNSVGWVILNIQQVGKETINNSKKFETTFGFEINIPPFKFSWSRKNTQ